MPAQNDQSLGVCSLFITIADLASELQKGNWQVSWFVYLICFNPDNVRKIMQANTPFAVSALFDYRPQFLYNVPLRGKN